MSNAPKFFGVHNESTNETVVFVRDQPADCLLPIRPAFSSAAVRKAAFDRTQEYGLDPHLNASGLAFTAFGYVGYGYLKRLVPAIRAGIMQAQAAPKSVIS